MLACDLVFGSVDSLTRFLDHTLSLLLSQAALRPCHFDVCIRPSTPLPINFNPLPNHPWPGGMREAVKFAGPTAQGVGELASS